MTQAAITQVIRDCPDFCIVAFNSANHCSNKGDPLGVNFFAFNILNYLDCRLN